MMKTPDALEAIGVTKPGLCGVLALDDVSVKLAARRACMPCSVKMAPARARW